MPDPVATPVLAVILYKAAEAALGKIADAVLTEPAKETTRQALRPVFTFLAGASQKEQRWKAFKQALDKAEGDFLAAHAHEKGEAEALLTALRRGGDQRPMELFAQEAEKVYLFSAEPNTPALARIYRRTEGFEALLRGNGAPPDEATVLRLLDDFFKRLRNTLLDDSLYGQLMVDHQTLHHLERIELLTERVAVATEKTADASQQAVVLLGEISSKLDALGKPLPEPNLDALAKSYLEHLVETYQFLDFKGIVQLEKLPVRLPLDQVYVSLHAQPELPRGETWERGLRLAGREIAAESDKVLRRQAQATEPVRIEEALSRHPGMVILGDPGAGKSTLLKYLTVVFARGQAHDRLGVQEARLPILLPVAAYAAALKATPRLALSDFLAQYYREVRSIPHDLAPLFQSALDAGRAVMLLDGLDEVTDRDQRGFVVERVQDFYTWHRRAGNRFLITSRVVGYRDAPLQAKGLAHFTLLDFGREEIERFVERWCLAFEVAVRGDTAAAHLAAEQERSRLLAAIFSNPGVERLAANPLLLTILALIHRQGTELPRRRVELYELYLKTLINSWALARNLDGRPIGPMDEVEAVKILAPLAYWMHSEKPAGTARRAEIEAQIARYYRERRHKPADEAESEARQFLEDVRRYAGLLAERGEGAYGFIHLTFEEYLAAREMIFRGQIDRSKTVAALCEHLYDPAWREPILLTAGYFSVIAKEEEAAGLVIRGLLDDQPAGENAGLSAVVAAACVEDVGVEGVTAGCAQAVKEQLLAVMTGSSIAIRTRADAGTRLGRLGDPRFAGYELEPEMVRVEAGPFVMGDDKERHDCRAITASFEIGKYPVTWAQFLRFIQAEPSPYAEPRYWTDAGWKWARRGAHRLVSSAGSRPAESPGDPDDLVRGCGLLPLAE